MKTYDIPVTIFLEFKAKNKQTAKKRCQLFQQCSDDIRLAIERIIDNVDCSQIYLDPKQLEEN